MYHGQTSSREISSFLSYLLDRNSLLFTPASESSAMTILTCWSTDSRNWTVPGQTLIRRSLKKNFSQSWAVLVRTSPRLLTREVCWVVHDTLLLYLTTSKLKKSPMTFSSHVRSNIRLFYHYLDCWQLWSLEWLQPRCSQCWEQDSVITSQCSGPGRETVLTILCTEWRDLPRSVLRQETGNWLSQPRCTTTSTRRTRWSASTAARARTWRRRARGSRSTRRLTTLSTSARDLHRSVPHITPKIFHYRHHFRLMKWKSRILSSMMIQHLRIHNQIKFNPASTIQNWKTILFYDNQCFNLCFKDYNNISKLYQPSS